MNVKTSLMPHQVSAVEKLLPSRVGAAFMEMGTGKTRTAIEVIHRRQAKVSKVVWFCPVSLKETIRHEIQKHTDSPRSDIHCFDQKTNQENIPKVFWYVVGIESMSLSARVILTINGLVDADTFVIVDESSYIKGHRSARTCWITDLSKIARYRMILTGTPISQGVVDLFAQFRFLSPKILGYASFYSFSSNHLEYSDRFKGLIVRAHNTEWIAAKIKPYIYQVTKDDCLDLPGKLYKSRYFPMTVDQWWLYEETKNEILSEMMDDDRWNSYAIFQLFTKLQQITSGFLNLHYSTKKPEIIQLEHQRLETLLSVIDSIPEVEKVIIWAKYEFDILEITRVLKEKFGEDSASQFYGKIKAGEPRENEIQNFRTDARFFVATQSCGGHGLTLNEANYVIYYNNGFKFAERMQSEDRCHRIGQTEPVLYIDLICDDSIDERIMTAIQEKGSVVQDFKQEIDKIKDQKDKIKDLVKTL